jgi:Arc/MetJ-type ribon-helix-helix transcriptional regulator
MAMAETVVKLRLNQQQLELMDRTIAQGVAPDRVALVRLALREYAASHKGETGAERTR